MDFCWVISFLYVILGLSCLGNHFGYTSVLLPGITFSHGKLFFLAFGLANGPLGWACIGLNNAMVFHSIEHMASLFIHGSPPLVAWSVRWYQQAYQDNWEGILGNPLFYPDNAEDVKFMDIFIPAASLYGLWAFFFLIWNIIQGRFHSYKLTGYDTIYHWNINKIPLMNKLAKMFGWRKDNQTCLGPVFVYQILHAVICLSLVSLTYLMWHSFWFHTFFVLSIIFTSCYNGSKRYCKMMTRYYEKSMEKIIDEHDYTGK
jgi:hypothetical protein